jgi:hypothetical protein
VIGKAIKSAGRGSNLGFVFAKPRALSRTASGLAEQRAAAKM